jgi:uncharacterized protein (DUF952 family)
VIFHITSREAWAAAADTYWTGDEAFVHFSFASQVAGTAQRYYAGVPGLIVLVVDEAGLDVRVENGFPHLYEPLPVSSVVEIRPLESFL